MTEQRDDYYYEIQLTNKQLVFYFLAGAIGLILSFLAGVMVGRGVDSGVSAEAQAAKPVQDERVIPEEPSPRPSSKPAEELTYAQRLESDKPDESLKGQALAAKPAAEPPVAANAQPPAKPAAAAAKPAGGKDSSPTAKSPASASSSPAKAQSPRAGSPAAPVTGPSPTVPREPASPHAAGPAKGKAQAPAKSPLAGTLSIQVGAFKEKDAAESVAARLKKKGYAAFVLAPEGADGLYNVRVGSYAARADAEHALVKLRDEEKFKPFIVKN